MKSILISISLLLFSLHASAITWTVDTDQDQLDSPAGAELSLREALRDANSGDTILFDTLLNQATIDLNLGYLDIDAKNLTITGPATTNVITLTSINNHLRISNASTVTVENIIFRDGYMPSLGGALYVSGASDVTLNYCQFIDNRTLNNGGAIRSVDSDLTLQNCNLRNNRSSAGHGGGIYHSGNDTSLILRETTVERNTAALEGGGIYITGGLTGTSGKFLDMFDCNITDNKATRGGGIHVRRCMMRSTRSTLAYNTAQETGGGLHLDEYGDVILRNFCIVENLALEGGGLYFAPDTTPTLSLCTIANNSATLSGGGLYVDSATLSLNNSAIAQNSSRSGADIFNDNSTITLGGNLFISNPQSVENLFPSGSPNGNGDYVGSSFSPLQANLSALGHYGGKALSMIPLESSLLVDTGGATAILEDQRGWARPLGFANDIGAVEQRFSVKVTTAVDENDGALGLGSGDSFREAVRYGLGGDTNRVIFSDALAGTPLPVNSVIQTLTSNTVIDASNFPAPMVLNGGGSNQLFEVRVLTTASMHHLTLRNGYFNSGITAQGGAVENSGTLTLDRCNLVSNKVLTAGSVGIGGALFSQGRLMVQRSLFAHNTVSGSSLGSNQGGAIRLAKHTSQIRASDFNSNAVFNASTGAGGAIAAYSDADLLIDRSRFVGNSASGTTYGQGGAVFTLSANLHIKNSIFDQNTTSGGGGSGNGGALFINGPSFIENSTFKSNTAILGLFPGDGGGVYQTTAIGADWSTTMENCTLWNNYASRGAALYSTNSSTTLRHVTVSQNSADFGGGAGIQITSGTLLKLENSIVAENLTPLPINGNDIENTGGGILSFGANLIGDNTTVTNTFPVGPLVGSKGTPLDPELGNFGFYGGPTETRPIQYGSPALDAAIANDDTPSCDQRGLLRPLGAAPDLGAYEAGNEAGYSAWAIESIPAGSNTLFNGDYENDLNANGWEYGAQLDPLNSELFPLQVELTASNGVQVTMPYRPLAHDLVYALLQADSPGDSFTNVFSYSMESLLGTVSSPHSSFSADPDAEALQFFLNSGTSPNSNAVWKATLLWLED